MNGNKVKKELKKSITILVPAGLVLADIFDKVNELAKKYELAVYLSTAQNIRILNVQDENEEAIKAELQKVGAELKGPGKFPLPRVCVGESYCKLGLVDTMALSDRILAKYKSREPVKPKFKIAIAGCPASCSNVLTTDIGIKATKSGYEVYVGGKGGASPKVGLRIAKGVDEERVFEIIDQLIDFHAGKPGTKMRMAKLLSDPDFPFAEV